MVTGHLESRILRLLPPERDRREAGKRGAMSKLRTKAKACIAPMQAVPPNLRQCATSMAHIWMFLPAVLQVKRAVLHMGEETVHMQKLAATTQGRVMPLRDGRSQRPAGPRPSVGPEETLLLRSVSMAKRRAQAQPMTMATVITALDIL